MGILYPWLIPLVAFIAAFILLYFFRKQFTRKTVSASFLWREVMAEWQAQNRFYKWQHNLLFWLQLFALLLLFGAAIRPYWYGEGIAGKALIFVVDTSASLTARGESRTLFLDNKEKMRSIVSKLDQQPVSIITTGTVPKIVLRKETDKNKILKAIEELEINFQHEQIDHALQLAAGLSDEQTAIHIFTDGLEKDQMERWLDSSFVHIHNAGINVDNVSLRSFGVGRTENGISGIGVIVNETGQQVEISLTVRAHQEIVHEELLLLEEKEERLFTLDALPPADYYVAEILVNDDYMLDNHLVSLLQNHSPGIIVIGEMNPFILRGFESLGVDVHQVQTLDSTIQLEDYILLSDELAALENPRQPVMFVTSGLEDVKELDAQVEQKDDELLKYVNLANVYIAASSGLDLAELETVARSGEVPLIQKGSINGFPLVAILFPLEASDWPLHANFPIFLHNTYEWLRRQTDFLGYFQPGEETWIPQISDNEVAIFTGAGEHLYTIDLSQERFTAPVEPGLYQAMYNGRVSYFTVQLDERERTFTRVVDDRLHEERLADESFDLVRKDDLWTWLLVICLIILICEWEVYRRHA